MEFTGQKPSLTIELLIEEARHFCEAMSKRRHANLVGVTDGKRIGTYIESQFKGTLQERYKVQIGSAAKGIDLPDPHILTDIKTTFITQPQSSSPFRNARQKIFGLGYNLLLFVYEKNDQIENNLRFLHARFIYSSHTADFQTTRGLGDILARDGNVDDLKAFLMDRNLPVDEVELEKIVNEILEHPPEIGYLTISNALQWRLQYSRVINEEVDGVVRIFDLLDRGET